MITKPRIFLLLLPHRPATLRLTTRIHSKFSNKLPKPSRFAEQLGLQKEFEQLQVKVVKEEKSTASSYELFIIVALCAVGIVGLASFMLPRFRSQFGLGFSAFRLSLGFDKESACLQSLQKVLAFQQTFFKDRLHSDPLTLHIIDRCIDMGLGFQQQKARQKCMELIQKALKNNNRNEKNQKQAFALYKKYLMKIYELGGAARRGDQFRDVLSYLVGVGDLEVLYLIAFLLRNQMISLSKEDKKKCLERLPAFRQQIAQRLQELKEQNQSQEPLLLDPYQFQCRTKQKWLKFISLNM